VAPLSAPIGHKKVRPADSRDKAIREPQAASTDLVERKGDHTTKEYHIPTGLMRFSESLNEVLFFTVVHAPVLARKLHPEA
jgi:hypothetical protein